MQNQTLSRQDKVQLKKLKKRKTRKKFFISISILLAIILSSSAWYFYSVYQTLQTTITNINSNELPPAEVVEDIKTDPFSILFIGIGTNGDDGQASLADSINLFTINPQQNYAEAVAIPRDSFVPFGKTCDWGAGYFDKITHATSASCLQTTLEDLLDTKINYYISIDFNGFVNIVDALGGVEMDVPDLREGFNAYPGDPSDGAYLNPKLKANNDQWCEHDSQRNPFAICFNHFGPQTVNGEQALALARSRHYDNDFGRSLRQSELIKSVITKATSSSAITSAASILNAVGDSIDTNVPSDQFISFADLGKNLLASKSSGKNSAFQMRTTQLAGIGGNFMGHRIQQKLYFSRVPIESIEDIRKKIFHSLSNRNSPFSPEVFDFTIKSDPLPAAFPTSPLLSVGDDITDPNDVKQYR
ncbi:MAG: LCP family protein [Culicoidibacterales bacterium]